jgi:hypothetical protein
MRRVAGIDDAAIRPTAIWGCDLAPLPPDIVDLLRAANASPRLAAHLRAVHDVAVRIGAAVAGRWPFLKIDQAAIAFGAGIHDIGKSAHPAELTGPGHAHESAGWRFLIGAGISPASARFTVTHAAWDERVITAPGGTALTIGVDDLLVSLADKVWKGHRITELEDLVMAVVVTSSDLAKWSAFIELDDLLARLADSADARLAFQAAHPI